jgi:hypothetical protein
MPANDQVTVPVGGRDYGPLLWRPTERTIRDARITGHLGRLGDSGGPDLRGYDEFWQWSVGEPEAFWAPLWPHFHVLGDLGDGPVLAGGPMPDVRWFGRTTLNSAHSTLRTPAAQPSRTAGIYRSEAGRSGTLSYGDLPICENTDRNVGLSHQTAFQALSCAAAGPGLRAVTITQITPYHGPVDGTTITIFTRGLATALINATADWSGAPGDCAFRHG